MTPQLVRRLSVVCVLFVAIAGFTLARDAATLSKKDGTTAQIVTKMVRSKHIAHPEIDNDLSARLLNRYVDAWDSQKLYFIQSDIKEFLQSTTVLDDKIQAGDVDFATLVFDRFRQRMMERAATITALIDADHDFCIEEEMVTDPDNLDWAASVDELKERWRKRIKFDLLMLRLGDTEAEEVRTRLHKRYKRNRSFINQTEAHEILELYLSAMTQCLDPHSTYMSPQKLEDFQIDMRKKLEGIGARLRFDDGYTVVEEVIDGGAAAADGRLVKGDKIIGVDPDGPDGPAELIDVVEMKLTKVVDNIRGKASTQVLLQVRTEAGVVEEYLLTRQTVQIEDQSVEGKIIEIGTWFDGRKERIGILNIPSFYRDFQGASAGGSSFKSTSRDVRKVLMEFNRQRVDALIVDLRWNGGGALTEAVEVSGLFIPRGPVVQVREPGDSRTALKDEDPQMYWRKPMIVVCNRFSASASEIFAGAIKDYRRGIIVGDRTTHGKGTVQNVMPVTTLFGDQRGALKLTISKFYRVNGDSTQNRGVYSDVVLPSLMNHREVGEDSLDNALAFDRIEHAGYTTFSSFLTDAMKEELARRSAVRVSADEDFQKVNKAIERYVERRNRKTISLNESTLRHEEEEIKREQEEEEEVLKKVSGASEDDDIFNDEFYNRELVQITLDYLELRESLRTVSTR